MEKFHPVHESRRGEFTRKAKRAGMSVDEYANHVLAKGSSATTLTKRQAAFTRGRKHFSNA